MFAYGTYDQFPREEIDHAADFPLWQAMSELSRSWVFQPTNGTTLPAVLTPAMDHYWNDPGELAHIHGPTCWGYDQPKPPADLQAGGWMSWIVVAPQTGMYTVTAETTAGGQALVSADDATEVARSSSDAVLSEKVLLTAGQHSLKIKCTAGNFRVQQLRADCP
jgi:hypothetical protein